MKTLKLALAALGFVVAGTAAYADEDIYNDVKAYDATDEQMVELESKSIQSLVSGDSKEIFNWKAESGNKVSSRLVFDAVDKNYDSVRYE